MVHALHNRVETPNHQTVETAPNRSIEIVGLLNRQNGKKFSLVWFQTEYLSARFGLGFYGFSLN